MKISVTLISAIFGIFTSASTFAAPLRHMHGEGENVSQFQLQHSCQIIADQDDAHWCNPAQLADNESLGAKTDLAIRADEKGAVIAQKAIFGKPRKADIESLFRQKSFAAVSGLGRLETIYRAFSISYTPVHVIAAYRVSNPALPEISLSGFKQSIFKIQGGRNVGSFQLGEVTYKLNAGASIYTFDREMIFLEDQLVNIAIDSEAPIGRRQNSRGFESDLGITLKNSDMYIPDFGFRVDRLNHRYSPKNYGHTISLASYLSRKSYLSLGKTLSLPRGKLGVETTLPFNDVLTELDTYSSSMGIKYSIGGLTAFVSGSALMESFGFAFQGPIYLVGIQYTDEKQPNDLQLQRQRMTYVYAKIHI